MVLVDCIQSNTRLHKSNSYVPQALGMSINGVCLELTASAQKGEEIFLFLVENRHKISNPPLYPTPLGRVCVCVCVLKHPHRVRQTIKSARLWMIKKKITIGYSSITSLSLKLRLLLFISCNLSAYFFL